MTRPQDEWTEATTTAASVPTLELHRHLVIKKITGYQPVAWCVDCSADWAGAQAAYLACEHTAATGHSTHAMARRVQIDYTSLGLRDNDRPSKEVT